MTAESPRYYDQLLSTREQLDVLRRLNRQHWDHFSDEEFNSLETNYAPPTPDNIPVIHAQFGSAWDTVDAWKKVFMTRRDINHWNDAPEGRQNFESYVRQHDQTARYEPGLHIVHMDMTQNHGTYSTMREVYAAAEETPNMLLAHSEGLALVGLHKALRESDDFAFGNTPYLPGYQARDVFVPDHLATKWDWTMRFEPSPDPTGWSLRMFPTRTNQRIYGSILLVHAESV